MKLVKRTPARKLSKALAELREHIQTSKPPRPDDGGCPEKPEPLEGEPACAPPEQSEGPLDIVRFHQRLLALNLAQLQQVMIAFARVDYVALDFGFLQQYEQAWEFRGTTVGRAISHIALAPLERRRVQVAQKRKTNLSRSDRTKQSSRFTYDAASSTKSSTSATMSSTSRNKWSVSASGSYGLGGVGWGASVEGNVEGSAEQSRQRAVENLVEETQKSSNEIISETETTTTIGLQTSFEHVEDHHLVNPYANRSLLISLSQLVSDYCVTTATTQITPCIIFDFDPVSSAVARIGPSVKFDEGFVSAHRHFLRIALLDRSLIDYLDSQDVLESTRAVDTSEISANAVRCLSFMFDDSEIFAPVAYPNFDIEAAFDITLGQSSFGDAVTNDFTDYYLLLATVRYLWRRDAADLQSGEIELVEYSRRAIEYVIALHGGLVGWSGEDPDDRRKLQDAGSRTEQFRRIPGFVRLADQLVLEPLGQTAAAAESDGATPSEAGAEEAEPPEGGSAENPRLSPQARIVNHLNCFGRYYTEEFLQFLHEWTGVAAIVELVAALDAEYRSLLDFLDFERSFVDGTSWIVPFAAVVEAQAAADAFLDEDVDFSTAASLEISRPIRMPADGVYIEASAGRCVLPELPEDSTGWVPASAIHIGDEALDVTEGEDR